MNENILWFSTSEETGFRVVYDTVLCSIRSPQINQLLNMVGLENDDGQFKHKNL